MYYGVSVFLLYVNNWANWLFSLFNWILQAP